MIEDDFDSPEDDTQSYQISRRHHYCTVYRMEELKTFYCDRFRKMPLRGLDPSMLIGFLCRDEADWWDFRRRVGEVCHFSFLFLLLSGLD